MDIYVLNRDFEVVGICDDYESIIWTTRYFTIGDFELYLPATTENINLLRDDLYLVREKDISKNETGLQYKNVMVIKKIQITTSIEDGNHLILTGPCLKSVISQRIIWSQTILRGEIENELRRIVDENAINPTIEARKISQLQLGTAKGFSDFIERQVTGDNLAEFLTDACTAYGIGWDVFISNDKLVFELYKGEDRSYLQTANPYVVFSPDDDNLLNTDYTFDKLNYKNAALVAGEGEGTARKTVGVGDASDLDRYELYIDSRNSSTNEGEITEEEYAAMLTEEGNETLKEDGNSIAENIEGEIEPLGNHQLGVDYFLGDIVEVINEYGIETTPRVIEIIESEDDNGSSTIPTFSTWGYKNGNYLRIL